MVYAIVQNIVGSVETQLQQFKIQEELNNNDLNIIVNASQVKYFKFENIN